MKKLIFLLIIVASSANLMAQGIKPKPVVLISGKGLNERNMEPLEAKIYWEVLPEGTQAGIARTNPLDGAYKIVLPFGKKYGYYAIAEGYYSVTKYLDVTDLKEYKEIEEQNLFLAPIQIDQVVRLNNIFFETGTATIKKESIPELNRLVAFLKVNKKIEIELGVHTDNQGKPEDNIALSISRAQAVASHLISNGIKEQRLTIKGYGDKFPLGFNTTEEGREMNRRVEFKVVSLEKRK